MDIAQLLDEAAGALREVGTDFATIGGCARNAYAEPRATKDVDFVVAANAEDYRALVTAFADRRFARATTVRSPDESVPDFESYRDPDGRRIDILFAKTEFERSALDRAEEQAPYRGVILPVVTPEDLVIYKLIAGRTQDWADVEVVVRTQRIAGRVLDWTYVEHWCERWEASERLAELRRRVVE